MYILLLSLIVLIALGLIGWIISTLKKGASGIKIMLLGISIIIFGGILVVDPNSNLGGIEYLISFIGVIFSVVGLEKID